MGDWVFGCDICQVVCPWNKPGAEVPSILGELLPREELLGIDLIEELGLSQAEFSARFKGSPIKRTKRRGYLRNVAVVLGNLKDPAALPVLVTALEEALILLKNRTTTEVNPEVLLEIRGAIIKLSKTAIGS